MADVAHDRVRSIAKHKPKARALAAVARFGFLMLNLIVECPSVFRPRAKAPRGFIRSREASAPSKAGRKPDAGRLPAVARGDS